MMKSNQSDNVYNLSLSLNGQKITLPQEKSVLFKNIDNNNFILLTKSKIIGDQDIMNLYIINGVSGRVIYNQYGVDVDFNYPINALFSDNNIYVSYFNINTLKYEIWVIEIFQNVVQNSFICKKFYQEMLKQFYFQQTQIKPNDYQEQNLNLVFLSQKYAFQLGIKKLFAFSSKQGITKKNLIIITPENQIYNLDRDLVSARRRSQTELENQQFQSNQLPPYDYNLPIQSLKMISYNIPLSDLKSVKIEHTLLESTSLLFVYGQDIFFKQFSPENTFDKLNDDFNYPLLVITVIIVFILTVFMRGLAINSKIRLNFK